MGGAPSPQWRNPRGVRNRVVLEHQETSCDGFPIYIAYRAGEKSLQSCWLVNTAS